MLTKGAVKMTRQAMEKFIYGRTEYVLNDIENLETFFDIRSYGFFPFWPSTAALLKSNNPRYYGKNSSPVYLDASHPACLGAYEVPESPLSAYSRSKRFIL